MCGFAPSCLREGGGSSPFDGVPYFSDWREMLVKTKADMAVVAPIFGLNADIIIQCAEMGINVFAEKPIATTLKQLDAVKRAVKAHKIRLCAMHYLRYTPTFYRAAEMVRAGAVGEVRMLTAQKSYKWGRRPEWYSERELYGGTVPWIGIHAIDWIYAFTGKRFLSVTAESYGSPETAALCQFRLEDGVIASVNLDYLRPSSAKTHGDDRVRCVGTDGVIEVTEKEILLINDQGYQALAPTDAPELLTEFLSGGNAVSPDEIFHLTRAALCARDAADTGRKVMISRSDKPLS